MSKYETAPVDFTTIEPTREFVDENGQRIVRIIDEKDLKEPMDLSIPKKKSNFVSLEEDNPPFLNQFDYELNYPLTPNNIARQSNRKIWWTIEHYDIELKTLFIISWKANVGNMQKGRKCGYLVGKRVHPLFNSLQAKKPHIAAEWHPTKNKDLKPTDVTCHCADKVWWFKKVYDEELNKVFELEWDAYIQERVLYDGKYDPFTTGYRIRSDYNSLQARKPHIAAGWHPTKNGDLKPTDVTCHCRDKVWWQEIYYDEELTKTFTFEWISRVADHVKADGKDNPFISGKKILPEFNSLAARRPKLLAEWDYSKNIIKPTEVTLGTDIEVYWKCSKGHSWLRKINQRTTKDYGCPWCNASPFEKQVHQILKKIGVDFEIEKYFKSELVNRCRYDIVIGDILIIEIDGGQHFYANDLFNRDSPFEDRIERDNRKNMFCLNNNLPLLRIPYIYNKDTNKNQIEDIIKYFVETKIVPQQIIDFYAQYEFSNYPEVATRLNEMQKQKETVAS